MKTLNSVSKKKQISKQKLVKINEKLSLLAQNLKTFPFIPDPRTLISISTHEKLFRDLNLWDFANLKLDLEIKKDFLTEFIACYDPIKRFSYVEGHRINLSRADLSKALSLPSKNHKFANIEFNATEFGGADKVSDILWGFILNKMVFLEDAAILPEEVANANSLVKAGLPNKVDWAGLIWTSIEKEVLDAPSSGCCYYASHLQCLIKFQKPRLFEEEENSKPSEATVAKDNCVLEEIDGGSGDIKCCTVLSLGISVDSEARKKEEDTNIKCSDDYDVGISQCDGKKELDVDLNNKEDNVDNMVDNVCAEEQDNDEKVEVISKDDPVDVSELTKGNVDMDKTVNSVTDVELCGSHKRKDDEANEEGNVMNKRKDDETNEEGNVMNFELGGLNLKDEGKVNVVNDVMDVEMGGLNEGNDGKARNDEVGEGNFPNLVRLNSSDFMQVMETNNDPSFNRDFFSMGSSDMHDKSMNLEIGQGGSLYFGNEHKRCNDETNNHAEEFQHKRFRCDQPWKQTPTVTGFDQLSEEMEHVMGKMKMDILEKERDFSNVAMQIQHVKEMLQQKDEIIRTLETNRMEAMRKRQLEASRFDHDLKHLNNTFYGCKRALKETQIRFVEYRNKYPIGGKKCDNELDAEGSKQYLENEKEMHHIIRSMITDFSKMWLVKMDNSGKLVSKYAAKLVTLKEQVDGLKESVSKSKNQTID